MTDNGLNTLSILHNDNLISILTYLTPPEILSIRKTCKRLYDITHARIVWSNACLKCIERGYPFPNVLLESMSTTKLERLSFRAHHLGQKWLSPEENLRPRSILHDDSISCAAVSDVRFVPGHDHKWLATISRSVWSVLTLWDVNAMQCRTGKSSARKCAEWSPKGSVFKSHCVNDDPTSEAIFAIGLLNCGENEMLHILNITEDNESVSFGTVKSLSTKFIPVTLHGDLVALSDEQSQVIVWNWKTNRHAVLRFEPSSSNSWKRNNCSQVLFSRSTESILVVRNQSIYLFSFPELRETHEPPLTYTNYARHHFGWVDGISATLTSHSISLLVRRKNPDPWSFDSYSMEYYVLPDENPTTYPLNFNVGHERPPRPPTLRGCIPNLRGSLSSLQRYSDIILGRNGTAVWISPQDRADSGLLFSDDAYYLSLGMPHVDRSNERLLAAVFHGPLWYPERDTGTIQKGLIWANDKSNWTAVDYEEDTGRIALGSSSGDLTVITL